MPTDWKAPWEREEEDEEKSRAFGGWKAPWERPTPKSPVRLQLEAERDAAGRSLASLGQERIGELGARATGAASGLERALATGTDIAASLNPVPAALNVAGMLGLIDEGAGDSLVGSTGKALGTGTAAGLHGIADLGRGAGDVGAFLLNPKEYRRSYGTDIPREAFPDRTKDDERGAAVTRGGSGTWLDNIAGGLADTVDAATFSAGRARGERDLAKISKGKWHDAPLALLQNPTAAASLAGSATGSLGSTMALGAVGRAAPLIGIGLQELHGIEEAQRAEEERTGRNINPLERMARQVGTAGAIAGLERIVPDELMRAAKGARGGAARAILTPLKEGGTEAAQRAIADIGGTPEGVFDPTGTLIEGLGGVMGGAALGPLHLGADGKDLPVAPPRDHLQEVLDFRRNLNDFKAANAQRLFNEAHEQKKVQLEKVTEAARAANTALAEAPSDLSKARAADLDAQRKMLEAQIAEEESGPTVLQPGERAPLKPTHVRELRPDEEILIDRGTPKRGEARGGGATFGFRDSGKGAGRTVDEIAETLQRWSKQDSAIPLDGLKIHDSVFSPEFYDQLTDAEKDAAEKARARGVDDAEISRRTVTPGFYGRDGVIHILAPRISNLGHLYDLVTGHEGTHLAAAEARGGAPDTDVAPEFYGKTPEQRMRTQAALAKRAKGKDFLGHALRPYVGSPEAILAEEALANAAEMAPTQRAPGRVDKAVSAVRTALRGNRLFAPFVSSASDAEIRVILQDVRRRLEARPRGAAKPAATAPDVDTRLGQIGEMLARAGENDEVMRRALLDMEAAVSSGDVDGAMDAASRYLETDGPRPVSLSTGAPAGPRATPQGPAQRVDVDAMLEEQRRNDEARAEAERRAKEAADEAAVAPQRAVQEAAARGRARDEARREEVRQAELDTKARLANEAERAQLADVVEGMPVRGADVLSNILERPGAVSARPQPRMPLPDSPVPIEQVIARTEGKKATGRAPKAADAKGVVPPAAGTLAPTAPAGKAKPGRKVRHSIRTRIGDEGREREIYDYSLATESVKAQNNPRYWVRYAVPVNAEFPEEQATYAAKATLRRAGVDPDNPSVIENLGPNGVWSKQMDTVEVVGTTWANGRPAYAYALAPNGTVSWAYKFPGSNVVQKAGSETKAQRVARIVNQTDPEHPFRVMQGVLAERGIRRDPTTDSLAPGGLATEELLAPSDSAVKRFIGWASDPSPLRGVRYEHGNRDVLTDEQIQKGLEDLRTGRFGTAEAHAINMRALDLERGELATGYNMGGKIRTAEEVFGRDERRVVGTAESAGDAPGGMGRGGVSRENEGLVAGASERGQAGGARGGELQAARGDAGVRGEPFPEANEPLPPFKARYSMAGASAQTANREELKRAQKMVRAGAADDEAWRETGWRRFPDGRWRFEISDHDAKLNDDVYARIPLDFKIGVPQVTLGELVNHPALFEAYPGLRDIRVVRASQDDGGTVAALDKKANKILLYSRIDREPEGQVSFLLHEIQHAIQDTEGFAKGGSPETVARSVPESEARQYAEREAEALERSAVELEVEADELDARARLYAPIAQEMKAIRDTMFSEFSRREERIASAMDKARERLGDELSLDQMEKLTADVRNGRHPGALMDRANEIRRRAIAMREDAGDARRATGPALQRYVDRHADTFEFYKRLAGEAEARQTQARQRLTPEERRARDPYQDFDVPPEKQLVDRRRYSVRGEPVTGEDGVRRLTIFHMSNRDGLEEIDPKFQGTGQAGAEMKRRYDDGFEPFSNWYTGEPGTVVEAHRFGGKPMYESEVELTNEPGGVIEADRVEGRTAAQLKAEGYTGVYFPHAGQVQMLVPVKPSPVGTAPRPGRPTARGDEFYREATGKEARFSRRQESTPEFKRWFGDSKVVDEQGRPKVVYHGVGRPFEGGAFDMRKKASDFGDTELGFFFTAEPRVADAFAGNGPDASVIPAYLAISKPYRISGERFYGMLDDESALSARQFRALRRQLESKGYDGIAVEPSAEIGARRGWDQFKAETYVAFRPEQIKSATGNRGTFDPVNPDIRFSRRQESTPEFKAWFGDWEDPKAFSSKREPGKEPVSQAVDAGGRPLVVYHGTRGDFGAFDTRTKGYNSNAFGSWETDRHAAFFAEKPTDAEAFTESGGDRTGGNIRPVYLNAKSPIDFTKDGSWFEDFLDEMEAEGVSPRWIRNSGKTWELFDGEDGKRFVEAAKKIGYDSVIFDDSNPDTGDSFRAWAVFDPEQVKSATGNTGAFDPADPDIRYSRRDPAESQVSWEALPGKSTGWLRGIHAAPYALRAAFTADIDTKVLRDALGRDRIARLFGVEETESVVAPGYWKGERNPSRQAFVRVPDGPDGLERVKAYAAARGYVLRQEAVGLHLARNTQAGERPNGYHTDIGRMPTASEYADFVAGINKIATPAEQKKGAFVPVPTHAGINMWTWDGSIPDERLRAVNDAALANIRSGATGEVHPLVVDSDLIENDWSEAPNGEIYVQRFTPSTGSPGVQGSLDQLRAAADKVGRQWASRHGWGTKLGAAEPAVPRDLESLVGRDVNPGLKGARRAKLFKDIARMVDGRALADMKFAAESGRAMKGWYRDSWQAIEKLFGEDAERFTSLLAALSPQQGVKENLRMAVDAWQTWVEAGRPSDPESVKSLFPVVARKWSESKRQWSNQYATIDLEARFNNTITALTDAPGTELSGSKVESFRRNLRGDLDAVTNDTWMAYFSEWQQKVFGTETGYLAGSYLVRRAAKKLGWTPAEVQETVWTFFRELANRTGVGGAKATDIAATMTMGDVISGSDSFTHLVRDTDVQKRFAALGLDVNSLPDLPRLSEEEASALAVRPEDRDSGVSRRVVGRAQRQADASWARGEIKAAGVDGLNDSDPAALKKLAVALGIPTEGRTRNQTIAALRAYADPTRYSRRDSPLELTRSTGPADIPLNVPQVESVVDRLVESEGFVQGKGASYTPKPLDSDKPRPHGVVEHEAKVADFRVTDEQLQRKVASGKPLTDKEVMLANIRMETRREEMNDATTRRLEAEAMSAADRTSKGVDLGRLRIEEIDATLAHINMVLVRKNAGTALARGLAAMARKMEPGTKLTPDILTMKLTGIPGIHPKSIADLYRKYQDGDIEGFREGVRKAIEPTWQHKWAEYYRGSLLTGIPTHMANFIGNIAEPALRAAETVAAAGVDKIVSTLRGTPRERFLGEVQHELRGQMKVVAPAFRQLAADLYRQVLLQKEPTLDLGRKFDHQVGAIGGRLGTLVRTPFRALGVADDFFKSLGFAAETEKRAYREARKEGLKGRDAERRAQEIIQEASIDPVGRWRGLMDAAHRGTLERVFQEDPARIVRLAMQVANDHPLAAAIVVPFLKTPGNITRTGWRRSPMGLLLPGDFQSKTKTFRAQQAELRAGRTPEGEIVSRGDVEDALARGAVGVALATTFGLLAAAGMMTGSGPTDDKEKNAKRATGWQPYSFVIPGAGGDGKPLYVPFSRFEPTASLLGNIADAFELGDERSVLDKVTTSISTNWTNKTYFKGLNDAAAAITTPNRAAKRFAGSIAAAHVPNIIAKTADAADPVLRETRSESGLAGLGETVKRGVTRRIPGVSRTAEPMYTATGEPVEKAGTGATRFLLPVQATSTKPGTELEAHMAKIHEVPGDVPDAVAIPKELLPPNTDVDWTGTRIFLTNEERAFLAKARRDAASQLRAELKQIQLLPVDEQRARIRRTFSRAQKAATKELWLKSPALRERARGKLER